MAGTREALLFRPVLRAFHLFLKYPPSPPAGAGRQGATDHLGDQVSLRHLPFCEATDPIISDAFGASLVLPSTLAGRDELR